MSAYVSSSVQQWDKERGNVSVQSSNVGSIFNNADKIRLVDGSVSILLQHQHLRITSRPGLAYYIWIGLAGVISGHLGRR